MADGNTCNQWTVTDRSVQLRGSGGLTITFRLDAIAWVQWTPAVPGEVRLYVTGQTHNHTLRLSEDGEAEQCAAEIAAAIAG